jgi:hypothetical protein
LHKDVLLTYSWLLSILSLQLTAPVPWFVRSAKAVQEREQAAAAAVEEALRVNNAAVARNADLQRRELDLEEQQAIVTQRAQAVEGIAAQAKADRDAADAAQHVSVRCAH